MLVAATGLHYFLSFLSNKCLAYDALGIISYAGRIIIRGDFISNVLGSGREMSSNMKWVSCDPLV